MQSKLLAMGRDFPSPKKQAFPLADFAGERFFFRSAAICRCKMQK